MPGNRNHVKIQNNEPDQAQGDQAAKSHILKQIRDITDQNRALLIRIFTYYCSFGEPLNTNKLRSAKFIKLLKDA